MKWAWLPLFALLAAIVIAGCGSDDDCILECAGQCQGSPTHACEADCLKKDCGITQDAPEEPTAEAKAALSFAASRVYAISSLYYQSGGCQHGSIATDSQARCNSPTDVVLAHWTGLTACAPTNASLTFQRQEWQQTTTVSVRASLRPVVDPPAGISSDCADQHPGAKWDSSGAQAWTTPGARGIGTDVSTASATATIPVNGTQTLTIPLGSALDGCAPTGECVLVLDADHHVWEYQGTFSLFYDCAGPAAVCGDGTIAGSEQCDDGLPPGAGDGCSAACAVETGWTCTGAPSTCSTACGDGVKAGAEQCDDGNVVSGDGCSTSCTVEVCTCQ